MNEFVIIQFHSLPLPGKRVLRERRKSSWFVTDLQFLKHMQIYYINQKIRVNFAKTILTLHFLPQFET